MDAFYALAEPRRRRIIELLVNNGQMPAGGIYKKLDITAQAQRAGWCAAWDDAGMESAG